LLHGVREEGGGGKGKMHAGEKEGGTGYDYEDGRNASTGIAPLACSAWKFDNAVVGSHPFCTRHRCANVYVRFVTDWSWSTRACCGSVCAIERVGQRREEQKGDGKKTYESFGAFLH
jgi:hypothetical protein